MISPKTQFLAAVVLSTGVLSASEPEYKMTIKNELFCDIFFNTQNQNSLPDKSSRLFVKNRRSETFLFNEDEKSNQILEFPGGWPSSTVQLPIEKHTTHFTIKKHPTERQKIIVEESDAKKVISEILILANEK